MKTRIAALSVVCTLAACADPEDGSEAGDMEEMLDQRVEVEDAGEGILRIQFPETVVPAGEERQTCWALDWTFEEDTLVQTMTTYQGSMGHHLLLFASTVPREAGDKFDCTQIESMTNLRPAVLADAAVIGGEKVGAFAMPTNFAVNVAAGTTLVMQAHYVNVSDKDLVFSDVADVKLVTRTPDTVQAGYFAMNHNLLDIPTGRHTRKVSCEVTQDTDFVAMFGHMHDWGESITIEREVEGSMENIWGVEEWRPDFRDNPPFNKYEPSAPLHLNAGDKLVLTCNYNNTLDHPLRFPSEMCSLLGIYFPAVENDENGVIICDSHYD